MPLDPQLSQVEQWTPKTRHASVTVPRAQIEQLQPVAEENVIL